MNALLLNQFFAPDPAPTGQLLADVAAELAAQGADVTVVCAGANCAVAASSSDARLSGIRILRADGRRFSRGRIGRVTSYATFYLAAVYHSLRVPKPDLVVTLTTPPLLSLVGTLLKKLCGSRHIIWEMDVYPDVAVALGVFHPRGIIGRLTGALADFARCRADAIIALGPCVADLLVVRGVPLEKIHIAENWADGAAIRPRPLPSGPFTVLYSGNLGLAHDVGTIAATMRTLKANRRFQFTFSGGGVRRKALEEICRAEGIHNARFLCYQEAARLPVHLTACHIGLVTQNPATLGTVVPSKTYALMAAGRPILFIGPRQSTPARIIEEHRCGWQIDPGDTRAAIELLEYLAANAALIRDAGARGREAFLKHYDLPIGVARICSILGVSQSEPLAKAAEV